MVSPVALQLPVIDVSAPSAAEDIDRAACEFGFFYITGHGIDPEVIGSLLRSSRTFFDLPGETKQAVHMSRGGKAWRGYFPVGGELTSGRPDIKEGIYFGEELGEEHPLVQGATPMHGPNRF